MFKKVRKFNIGGLVSTFLVIVIGLYGFGDVWLQYSEYTRIKQNGEKVEGIVSREDCSRRGESYMYVRLQETGEEVFVDHCGGATTMAGESKQLLHSSGDPGNYQVYDPNRELKYFAVIIFSSIFILAGLYQVYKLVKKKQ
jgi:hypothetical protein